MRGKGGLYFMKTVYEREGGVNFMKTGMGRKVGGGGILHEDWV